MTYLWGIWHSIEVFGFWHANTLTAFFPPFYGWDMGCGYCAKEAESIRLRKCARGKAHKWTGCGTNEE